MQTKKNLNKDAFLKKSQKEAKETKDKEDASKKRLMEEELRPIKRIKSDKMYEIYCDDMVVFNHGGLQ